MSTQKKLHNRFDEYEIASVYTEYAEDYLPTKWKIVRNRFIIKCILGVLLFLNGYLSHWGPWPWPSNYYFLIFSVIFYHVATYFYAELSPVKNHQGNTIGEYRVGNKRVVVVLKIGESKQQYTLEARENKNIIASKAMNYPEYFTQSGVFLSYKFKNDLEAFTQTASEAFAK